PRTDTVPAENIDFSTAKPVLTSEALPKPSEPDPATKESVPFRSWRSLPDSEDANEPSSRTRRIGRFAVDRSTHFQSSSSVGPRNGASWIASNKVFNVTLRTTLLPARKPIRSRNAGRNEGADTLIV